MSRPRFNIKNDDDYNMVIEMIIDMKKKFMFDSRICKSLNTSNNSITNYEVANGTSNEGDNKILTS